MTVLVETFVARTVCRGLSIEDCLSISLTLVRLPISHAVRPRRGKCHRALLFVTINGPWCMRAIPLTLIGHKAKDATFVGLPPFVVGRWWGGVGRRRCRR